MRNKAPTRGPVVDVPVVGGLVDELVVDVQLWLRHAGQVSAGKRAQNQPVLQHTALPGLVQKSGAETEPDKDNQPM